MTKTEKFVLDSLERGHKAFVATERTYGIGTKVIVNHRVARSLEEKGLVEIADHRAFKTLRRAPRKEEG